MREKHRCTMVKRNTSKYLMENVRYVLLTLFKWIRVVLDSLQRWQHSVKKLRNDKKCNVILGFNVT
jgi:DNA-binding HxlR family transcriptional regulator